MHYSQFSVDAMSIIDWILRSGSQRQNVPLIGSPSVEYPSFGEDSQLMEVDSIVIESDESSDGRLGQWSVQITVYVQEQGTEPKHCWIDENSTYGNLHYEVAKLYPNHEVVILSGVYGKHTYWEESPPEKNIGFVYGSLYAVATTGPLRYTLAIVQTNLSDYPVALFDFPKDINGTILDAITAVKPDLLNVVMQIAYYSIPGDIQGSHYRYDSFKNQEMSTFPTIFCVTINEPPAQFLENVCDNSIPPFLQRPLVHCKSILQRVYDIEIPSLQTAHVARSALHLINSLAATVIMLPGSEERPPSSKKTDDEEIATFLRMAPVLADEIQRILNKIEELINNPESYNGKSSRNINDIFTALCGNFPGAATIRRSFSTFEDLKSRDIMSRERFTSTLRSGGVFSKKISEPSIQTSTKFSKEEGETPALLSKPVLVSPGDNHAFLGGYPDPLLGFLLPLAPTTEMDIDATLITNKDSQSEPPVKGTRLSTENLVSLPTPVASGSHGPQRHMCVVCGHRYDRVQRARDCAYRDRGLKPYACDGQCGKTNCKSAYSSVELLNRHFTSLEDRVQCPKCGRTIGKKNLARHRKEACN